MVFTIPYVAMQAIGCSYIFTTMSGGTLSYTVGASVFMVVMIILVWMGGMKGVAITDAAQGVFMWVGLVFGSLWVVLKNFPSVADARRRVCGVPQHCLPCRGRRVYAPCRTGFPAGL